MSNENRTVSFWWSWVVSLAGWILVGAGTISLFLIGLFFLWPASFLFDRASGYLPHRLSQFWARLIERLLPFWEIQTSGLERIEKGKPYIIVSNHQSLLDIMVVLAKLPLHFKFIAKEELFPIPFLGWHLALAGYISLKRGDRESGRLCLFKARDWLRRGVSVIFFPEGTRSPNGKIHEFKPGAFKLALEEKIDILPLAIVGTREAIPKHAWRIERRSLLHLQVLEPVSVQNLAIGDLEPLRKRVREQIVEEFQRIRAAEKGRVW